MPVDKRQENKAMPAPKGNKYAINNQGGRPRLYKNAVELNNKISEFFRVSEEKKTPYTISKLALYLGLSRQGLLNYKGRKEYVDAINKAVLKCADYVETMLLTGRNPIGSIFWLKNNAGWEDKTQVEKQELPFSLEIKKSKPKIEEEMKRQEWEKALSKEE